MVLVHKLVATQKDPFANCANTGKSSCGLWPPTHLRTNALLINVILDVITAITQISILMKKVQST